jgi:hypothetical protein
MNDVMRKTFHRHAQLTLIFNPKDKREVESFIQTIQSVE